MADHENRKVGLALSGGGFRASFFHIGVMASLAERGILGEVDILSTVSGGSVIGALYILRLKELFESRSRDFNDPSDVRLERRDYVDLIRRIEDEFVRTVQKNIRVRIYTNIWSNLKMNRKDYSRSDRVGDLYGIHFYGKMKLELRSLDTTGTALQGKLPNLIMNATSLNTGHVWRFQENTMGEPPKRRDEQCDFDKNLRLRRPAAWDDVDDELIPIIPLGISVAASTCVPGLFPPLSISNMYEDFEFQEGKPSEIRVQLIDGGVFDNLGVVQLIDEECDVFHISDASGQLKDYADPPSGTFQVIARVNSILMDRVREESLMRAIERSPKNYYHYHLRKGLNSFEVSYKATAKGKEHTTSSGCSHEKREETEFGVNVKIQEMLAQMRTDLDSFSDIEANALMCDGYLMCDHRWNEETDKPGSEKPTEDDRGGYNFLKYRELLKKSEGYHVRCLRAAKHSLVKPFFMLKLGYRIAFVVSLLAVLSISVYINYCQIVRAVANFSTNWWPSLLSLAVAAGFAVIAPHLIGFLIRNDANRKLIYSTEHVLKFLMTTFVQSFLLVVSWINLFTLHKLFNWLGSEKRILGKE